MLRPRLRPALCLVVSVLSLGSATARAADPGMEFFEKKVRPVLVEHCYSCHSTQAKKQKGGLLLDSREAVRKGGESGPAVVPGKPKESLLVKAIHYSDDGLRMPPKGKLPPAVIADLEQWIALGAPDPRSGSGPVATPKGIDLEKARAFWSFQPLRRVPPPAVQDAAWPRGDIDRFILARLEARRLKPSADADRATLLRRVYFDLIGLPPTPEQIDAFVRDPAPDAFARVVDELLASPHFGERWGRYWLDVARFAESSGGGRSLLFKDAWRYRDYVIETFNADRPYNRFVAEQVAGDLLPAATPEDRARQVVATAFLALGPTNYERQDKEVLELDVIDEQIDTIGRTFLGMTLGCARCHDHKFDPVPTRDYYALAGIFKSTQTLIHDNVSRWIDVPLPTSPEQEAALKAHESAVAALKERLRLARAAEKRGGKPVAAAARRAVPLSELPGIVIDDAQAKQVGTWTQSRFSGSYIGAGYLHDADSDKGKKTLTFVPEIPRPGRYEVRLAYVPGTNRATKVPVTVLHVEGEQTFYLNQTETPALDGRFVSLGTFRFDTNGQWFVLVSNEETNGHVVVDAVQFLPADMAAPAPTVAAVAAPAAATPTASAKELEEELKRLEAAAPQRPLAMGVKEAAKVEDCHILIRGNIQNRGDKAPRGFLQIATASAAPALPAKESGRRQLAEWLTRRDNPLTARVMANRVWHYLMGTGLVRTVDNFGTVGEAPSHPELLDHLALRFMDEGWSVKQLVRAVVLSRTYQQASGPRADGLAADPENRLLWRMPRRRLDAEALRDAMLAVSGRLERRVGGPTIRPGTSSEYGYTFDDCRRSVYTPIFRNRLPELFEVFDFADPNLATGRRNVSTVATQALYLMNNPFVMDEARAAARGALALPGDDAARVARAYRTALGRLPTPREQELALRAVAAASPDARQAAWERLYQALFASIDFRYVN